MVMSPGSMGKTNECMWNSSTHAMSDICALAYRRNVPACEQIVPAEVGASDRTFESRDNIFQNNVADVSWNKVGNGRGRGALLQNRDLLHRNDQELKKQLRFANGLGYGNDLIEAEFQNVLVRSSHSQDGEETDKNSHGTSTEKEAEDTSTVTKQEEEEDDISMNENGEWNWEKRTAKPAPNRVVLKNVALESILRQKSKGMSVKPEEKVSSHPAPTPTNPDRDESAPHASVAPKVKEDWRAENKAAEEAQNSNAIKENSAGTSKAKKGWRSTVGEPLLGDLKIDANWSVFAPNVITPLAPEGNYLHVLPTPEPDQQTSQESTPRSLLDNSFDLPQRGKKNKKKKKKKNLNVRVMYVPPAERSYPEPNIAPPGYLMPINGVSPMAIRNSEYNPLLGQNIHRTFGNIFEKTIRQLVTSERKSYNRCDTFSLTNDEFPRLK